jgi:hypothetical protein
LARELARLGSSLDLAAGAFLRLGAALAGASASSSAASGSSSLAASSLSASFSLEVSPDVSFSSCASLTTGLPLSCLRTTAGSSSCELDVRSGTQRRQQQGRTVPFLVMGLPFLLSIVVVSSLMDSTVPSGCPLPSAWKSSEWPGHRGGSVTDSSSWRSLRL